MQFSEEYRSILDTYLTSEPRFDNANALRPVVTLTFATSLDSCLSLAPGVQTALSGSESKAMTHYLRSRHDAILIGAGTAVADDPSLNCRLDGCELEHQPRPIVLDPSCRWAITSNTKIIDLTKQGKGRAPWIYTLTDPSNEQVKLLEHVGGKYVKIEQNPLEPNRMSWDVLLRDLKSKGIESLMIEGGGQIINKLLTDDHRHLIDLVIITIAPVWLGRGGVSIAPERTCESQAVSRLSQAQWTQMGGDVVLCGKF